MNDKEKQIEEMAKCMCSSYESGKGCKTCPTIWCYADECATMAFAHNYRKLPENAVVLTREELQDLKEYKNIAEQRKFNLDYANVELRRLSVELNSAEESNAEANRFLDKYRKELEIIKQQLAQARKETAEKILTEVGKVCGDYQWFKNLCKQYGLR